MKQRSKPPVSEPPFVRSSEELYIIFHKRMAELYDLLVMLVATTFSSQNFPAASDADKQELLRKALIATIEIEEISEQIITSMNITFMKEGIEQTVRSIFLFTEEIKKISDFLMENIHFFPLNERRNNRIDLDYPSTLTRETLELSRANKFKLTITDVDLKYYSVATYLNVGLFGLLKKTDSNLSKTYLKKNKQRPLSETEIDPGNSQMNPQLRIKKQDNSYLVDNKNEVLAKEPWEKLIHDDFKNHLARAEGKLKSKIAVWRQGEKKIECAAFCALLFEMGFFVNGSTKIKSVNSFARSKYGTDIRIQLESAKKKDRQPHMVRLRRYFS